MEEIDLPPIYYCIPVVITGLLIFLLSAGAGNAMGRIWEKSHLKSYLHRLQRLITHGISHIRHG